MTQIDQLRKQLEGVRDNLRHYNLHIDAPWILNIEREVIAIISSLGSGEHHKDVLNTPSTLSISGKNHSEDVLDMVRPQGHSSGEVDEFDSTSFKRFLKEHGSVYDIAKPAAIKAIKGHLRKYPAVFGDDDSLAVGAGVVAALIAAKEFWNTRAPITVDAAQLKHCADTVIAYENERGIAGQLSTLEVCRIALRAIPSVVIEGDK